MLRGLSVATAGAYNCRAPIEARHIEARRSRCLAVAQRHHVLEDPVRTAVSIGKILARARWNQKIGDYRRLAGTELSQAFCDVVRRLTI